VDTESHELIAGYALDALDDADRARAEALLAFSEEARDELRAYSDVATAMATAVSGPAPVPELRERVLGAVRAEPQNVVSLDERRRSRAVPVLAACAAVAACVALVAGIWGFGVSSDLDDTRAALARERAAAAVLADPNAQSVALESGDGRLVVGGDGKAVLVVDSLAPAPPGKTYELWVSDGGAPVPAGVFSGAGDRDVVPVDQPVETGSVVLVTVEPEGGVDAPTTKPIVASQPV
jgi:anti-sigma-K factor RskA